MPFAEAVGMLRSSGELRCKTPPTAINGDPTPSQTTYGDMLEKVEVILTLIGTRLTKVLQAYGKEFRSTLSQ
jgi:hypothetical protein